MVTDADVKHYKFIFKIAIKYRLSIESVARLAKRSLSIKKDTEEYKEALESEKKKVYNVIRNYVCTDDLRRNAMQYLFLFETPTESREAQEEKYNKAQKFYDDYMIARLTKRYDDSDKMLDELNSEEIAFKNLDRARVREQLTTEDALVITNYRLKYAISRDAISKALEISHKSLSSKERTMMARYERGNIPEEEKEMLSDVIPKIKNLTDYYGSLFAANRRRRF